MACKKGAVQCTRLSPGLSTQLGYLIKRVWVGCGQKVGVGVGVAFCWSLGKAEGGQMILWVGHVLTCKQGWIWAGGTGVDAHQHQTATVQWPWFVCNGFQDIPSVVQ
jgi:hypothetical protein